MIANLVKEVESSFQKQFKSEPLIVFSPGRINLIGEHTDYNEGFVFPAAIDKGIALAIQKSEDSNSKVFAVDKSELYEFSLDDIKPLKNGDWRNYILGVVAELQVLGKEVGNFNGVFSGNIPGGAGMSSSAALENSFVFGLNELFNLGLTKEEMIYVSQKAEHNFAGVKCGIMDQYASMFGIEDSALLLDCRTVTAKPYQIDFKDYELMLINTNVKHDLAETAYNDRRAVCENVSEMLGIVALRDATTSDLDKIKEDISEEDYQKALYVIEENNRVKKFAAAIEKDDLGTLGSLLFQSHDGLSIQYKVSCTELDFLVTQAQGSSDVIGARMMGGGFGGCTINLVRKSGMEKFKKQVSENFKDEFGRDCSIYEVKLSQGTHLVN
ncbi:galactokinase [Gelidibacter maritimus]|uniref:Galactokinase n=1 Tax=Gelidibacter maritimus TaxID=2761487 RepID=A0A7W2R3N5_9FLAO|nr:galactokinase [Gelidibacter maritimus]MBA6152185.1 galactokinase [Gelidibacter maritimus]